MSTGKSKTIVVSNKETAIKRKHQPESHAKAEPADIAQSNKKRKTEELYDGPWLLNSILG